MKYFGGIEGGATHSRAVILNECGECVASTTGSGTNHWVMGIPECARRIADMVNRAKDEANIPLTTPLASLGLSLSGCEQESTNRELESHVRSEYPTLSESYVVTSDTTGSIATASPNGGLVVISGTGSNAQLINPDGKAHNCGGWGHFLGDEGSAWYISHRAVKIVFNDLDGFVQSPYPVDCVWRLIREHFHVETRHDLLSHCYAKFDKPYFAGLCKKLAQAAEEDGDKLCRYLFTEAGRDIAASIGALMPKVQSELVRSGVLTVVCVGSVFLSWPLLRDGFLGELDRRSVPFDLNLVQMNKPMSYGACYLASDDIAQHIPRNYGDNVKVLYRYKSKAITNGNGNGNGPDNCDS